MPSTGVDTSALDLSSVSYLSVSTSPAEIGSEMFNLTILRSIQRKEWT